MDFICFSCCLLGMANRARGRSYSTNGAIPFTLNPMGGQLTPSPEPVMIQVAAGLFWMDDVSFQNNLKLRKPKVYVRVTAHT